MKDRAPPFDAAQDLADAPRIGGAQRPKDAATLILTRGEARPEVLMGRRAPGHVFMASKWVFPGGRIDRADFNAASTGALASDVARRLEAEVPGNRARALALTAVRETFEETGLILGRPAPSASVAGPWRDYRQAGALPDLAALSYIARAITPPGRTRRFDARFFMASAEALLTPEPTAGSGELDEIAWLPLDEARTLDLPAITRFVLGELAERFEHPDRPLPFVRMVRGRHVVDHRD
ncbi:NUDIX domain-containing protein [Brevundimonas sp.]|jgi:8-oxo-dGTP pyrophosphatase MutT (NUDIX family)|uniref:NUDIX hydrolase n=1 Tax=Brevundimonas sp. TaxID=1871086 RepID=UPI0017FA5244|nr:NUDIX domain-containing protein [Brevundimonas sp.]MBA4807540.1 NUDIX domain-containing protein [Brevundimonas sp.]